MSAGKYTLWLLLILFASSIQAQQGTLRMQLGAAEISIEETVKLTVIAVGHEGELNTSALDKDFEIVGRSSNLEMQSQFDGNKTNYFRTRSWVLELAPKAIGRFIVPPVSIGQEKSKPLVLNVTPPATGAKRDIYVEATVDTMTPWVQSQVLLTVRVFQGIEIVDGSLDAPTGDGLNIEQLGDDKRINQIRDGRRYAVTERRFAVFPQRSGKLVINPVLLAVSIPTDANRVRGFFTPTKSLRRQTDAIELDVQARPAGGGRWWLPAQKVTLEEQWSEDPSLATVDQPITRTLVLRAVGASGTQLPRIERPSVQGLSIYAEDPVSKSVDSEQGLISEQRINWAIIPETAGNQELPPISLDWFNTLTGKVESVELPAASLRVTSTATPPPNNSSAGNSVSKDENSSSLSPSDSGPSDSGSDVSTDVISSGLIDNAQRNDASGSQAANSSLSTSVATQQVLDLKDSVNRWQWLSAGLLIGLLATLGWALMQRRSQRLLNGDYPSSGSNRLGAVREGVRQWHEKLAPLAEVELCCREDDFNALSQAILRWAARQFPEQPPRSLSALADRFEPHQVSKDLRLLDADLYQGSKSDSVESEKYRTLAGTLRDAVRQSNRAAGASDHARSRGHRSRDRGAHEYGLPEL